MAFNFSFGTATTTAAAAQNKTFSFGTATAATPSTGLTFGTPAASTGSSLFSKPANPTSTAAVAPFGVATATPAASTSTSLFGAPAATTASTGLFGTSTPATGGLFGSTTTSTTGGLFGSTATTSAPSLFGATTGGTGLTGLSTFGTAPATTSTGLTLGSAFSSTPSTVSKGLGGVDPQKTQSASDGSINGKSSDSKVMKETNVPNEIATIVENFKKYVKDQKTVREDIARITDKPIFRVKDEVKQLRQSLAVSSNGLQRNAIAVEKLKQESALELKNVEIAQRTKDTPPGLQYENTAPMEYFQRLVEDFEHRMISYRQQIETVEQHFLSLQQPTNLSPQELTMLLRKIHETFIALAAQLQVIHEAVKDQKEHMLSYRKVFQGDSTDIFELRRQNQQMQDKTHIPVGPTPFSEVSNAAAVAMATALNRGQQPTGAPPTLGLTTGLGTQNQTQLGFGANQGNLTFGANTSAFGAQNTSAFGSTTQPAFGSPFALQKPPLGNKRGKTK